MTRSRNSSSYSVREIRDIYNQMYYGARRNKVPFSAGELARMTVKIFKNSKNRDERILAENLLADMIEGPFETARIIALGALKKRDRILSPYARSRLFLART